MKIANVLLVVAGIALAWVAVRHTLGSDGAAAAGVPQPIPATLSGEVPEGCVVHAFAVEGMCCDSCATKLYEPLAAIEGVEEIAIDPLAGRVSAVVSRDVDVTLLAGALNRDKYTARPIE